MAFHFTKKLPLHLWNEIITLLNAIPIRRYDPKIETLLMIPGLAMSDGITRRSVNLK